MPRSPQTSATSAGSIRPHLRQAQRPLCVTAPPSTDRFEKSSPSSGRGAAHEGFSSLPFVCSRRRFVMTFARHLKQAGLALLMLSSLAALQNAYAVGTTAGTSISNTATVNYSVGGVSQTPITSAAATFVVDNKI